MELLIKLDDDIAKGIRGENDCKVEPREIVRSFQATIADAITNGIPYNSSGDSISRKQVLDELLAHQYSQDFCKEHGIDYSINSGMVRIIVNSAPTVELDTSEIEYSAYCKGLKDGINLSMPS